MEKHERLAIQEDAVKDISVEQMKKWSGDFLNAKGAEEKKNLRLAFKKEFGVNFSKNLADEVLARETEESKEKKASVSSKSAVEAEDAKLLAEVREDINSVSEEPKDAVLEKFKDFNITEDEIKTIKGFSELTQAQQALVYDGLKQMSLVEVKSRAQEDFKESMKEKGFFGRILKGLTKRYDIAKNEKEEVAAVKRGGLPLHQSNLEELTAMISAMKIDGIVENGEVKVKYLSGKESLSAEQKNILNDFNDVADRFGKIPQEWSLKTATQKERGEYQYLSALYENTKADALEILKTEGSDKRALLEVNEVDYQVKMMQFLAAHPEIDKEFSKIENQSAFKKMITGEAVARGSYMAGGFAVRHTLAGLIGFGGLPVAAASFAAAPLAAAGIGAWRGRDRAKTSLIEKDIAGRKKSGSPKVSGIEQARKDIVKSLKELIPSEYALKPQEWYEKAASEEDKKQYDRLQDDYQAVMNVYQEQNEKESDKTEKHFYQADDLTGKLEALIAKAKGSEGDEFRSALLSLKTRAQFTEDKLSSGLINFGEDGALSAKLDLVQALSEARATITLNSAALEKKEKDLDPQKDLEKRFSRLFDSKYLEFNKNLDEARKKYIKKEMIKGAGIGAAFAIGGVLLRDLAGQLGIIETHGGTAKLDNNVPEHVTGSAKAARLITVEQFDDIDQNINIEETKAPETFFNMISNKGLGGQSDSVWHSTKEIFVENAEKLGYKGDINDYKALGEWAEIQTNGAIHNSGEISNKVFEGNMVHLEKDEAGNFFVQVEAGEGAEPGMLGQEKPVMAEKIEVDEGEKVVPKKLTPLSIKEAKLSGSGKMEVATGSASTEDIDTGDIDINDQEVDNDTISAVETVSANEIPVGEVADTGIAGHNVVENVEGGEHHVPTISEAIDIPEADNSQTLGEVMAANSNDVVDKVLLEFAKEKGASSSTTVKELLDTYPGITAYMDENAGDSIYAHLYDLRHAGSGEQAGMLTEDLQANLKDELSDAAKTKLDVLSGKNAFQVGKDTLGEPVLTLKLGAAQKQFEFSADGFKGLKEFVKSIIEKETENQ